MKYYIFKGVDFFAKATLPFLKILKTSPFYKDQYRIADMDYLVDTSQAKRILA